MVRIYVGTALILPAVATGAIAHSSPNTVDAPPAQTNTILVASNLRIDTLTQAIERHPENAALYNSRGWYNFLDGNYAETVADYGRVIELGIENIDPVYHTSVYHVRGLAYVELGEKALAIESLQVAGEMYRASGESAGVEAIEGAITQLSE
ncbi:MAG: hypothetical protein AAF635_08765 [Cyanobacteria bacterium P01_C01_bin.69]